MGRCTSPSPGAFLGLLLLLLLGSNRGAAFEEKRDSHLPQCPKDKIIMKCGSTVEYKENFSVSWNLEDKGVENLETRNVESHIRASPAF